MESNPNFTFNRARRQQMLDGVEDAVKSINAKLLDSTEMTWTKIDPSRVGVLRLPETLLFVLHSEEPVAALGWMNGRVSFVQHVVGDDWVRLTVPIDHPSSGFRPWVSIWRGEQLFGVADDPVERVLYPGDTLEFGPGSVWLKGWRQ